MTFDPYDVRDTTPIMVAAIDANGAIGLDGDMPWTRCPEDLANFYRMTKGHTVIMGRKTFELTGPLPDRRNIVISRARRSIKDVSTHIKAPSYNAAMSLAADVTPPDEQIFIIGGESVYAQAFRDPRVGAIALTTFPREYLADAYFPEIDTSWRQIGPSIPIPTAGHGVLKFTAYSRSHN